LCRVRQWLALGSEEITIEPIKEGEQHNDLFAAVSLLTREEKDIDVTCDSLHSKM
jgi:hypothetical protein